jgi:putative sterol carrier protein
MSDSTAAFFDELAQRGHEPVLTRAKGTLRLDLVDGKKTESWLVSIDKGDVSVARADGEADCVVRTDRALFDRMAAGQVNAMAAVLRGEAAAVGDTELLVLFQRLFPSPPPARRRRKAKARR